jgi:hypothetical protein
LIGIGATAAGVRGVWRRRLQARSEPLQKFGAILYPMALNVGTDFAATDLQTA